jgi:hypothetical protein
MRRFYFDVHTRADIMPDLEGSYCATLDAAEHEATQTAVTLARDWLPRRAREVCVEVKDEQHRVVLTVTVALTIERLE